MTSTIKLDYNLISDIITSRKYILNMLKLRGFDISKYESHTNEELKILIDNQELDMVTTLVEDNTKMVYVKYLVLKNKIKNNTLEKEISELLFNNLKDKNQEDYEIIIIIKDKPSDSLLKVIDNILSKKYFIQLFWIKSLLYNLLEHDFVPKHRILNNIEIDEVKKKYNIKNNYMPVISRNDPVAQYLGMKPGQMCEITRRSETSGEYLTYRICA